MANLAFVRSASRPRRDGGVFVRAGNCDSFHLAQHGPLQLAGKPEEGSGNAGNAGTKVTTLSVSRKTRRTGPVHELCVRVHALSQGAVAASYATKKVAKQYRFAATKTATNDINSAAGSAAWT